MYGVLFLANLQSVFLSLPSSALNDDMLAIVLPLFEMNHYSLPCTNWYTCSEQYVSLCPFWMLYPSSFCPSLHNFYHYSMLVMCRYNSFFDLKKYDLNMCVLTGACKLLSNNGVNVRYSCEWVSFPLLSSNMSTVGGTQDRLHSYWSHILVGLICSNNRTFFSNLQITW